MIKKNTYFFFLIYIIYPHRNEDIIWCSTQHIVREMRYIISYICAGSSHARRISATPSAAQSAARQLSFIAWAIYTTVSFTNSLEGEISRAPSHVQDTHICEEEKKKKQILYKIKCVKKKDIHIYRSYSSNCYLLARIYISSSRP